MTELPRRTPAYKPIEDYGVIGNLTTTALVRLDGTIDWCCFPFLDSPSVFAAVVDAQKGGFFMIRPTEFNHYSQHYIEFTNILVTVFRAGEGRLEVWDYMPTGKTIDCTVTSEPIPEFYRKIRCTHGSVDVDVVWAPRHDYARANTTIERTAQGFVALGGEAPFGLAGLPEGRLADTGNGPAAVATLSLTQGEEHILLNRWNDVAPHLDYDQAEHQLQQTIDVWLDWVMNETNGTERPWAGKWESNVIRSELFLKLMAQQSSGALAAAPTTSLPESIGGVRNWDYRYTWIRDAAQIAQAFFALGHQDEADAFIKWAEYVACSEEQYAEEGLQILYPLRTEVDLTQKNLDHLEGYRQSSPVHIGNAAANQLQLDVYGELLNAVYERVRLSEDFDVDIAPFLSHIVEEAGQTWHHPDFGIWELKSGPDHLVYSKIMSWVALDRACWLCEQGYLSGDVEHWRVTKDEIRDQIISHGCDEETGAFQFSYNDSRFDAANLLIPMTEFLPPDNPRVQATIDGTLENLVTNDLVYRYHGDDGLPGEEGAFVLCTCWLVDALAMSHRLDEANRIFENLMNRTNHLGLLSEQIDPFSGEFLGNFPQAYSHLGIINSTLYLAIQEGRKPPIKSLLGARNL